MLDTDEVFFCWDPQKDDKGGFTALISTTASGDVPLLGLIFDGLTQPPETAYVVNGQKILEAANDSHWSNELYWLEFQKQLLHTIPPCSHRVGECVHIFNGYDRFSGHYGRLLDELEKEKNVQRHIFKYTYVEQPNVRTIVLHFCCQYYINFILIFLLICFQDDIINHIFKKSTQDSRTDFYRKRALVDRERAHMGKDELPQLSLADRKMLFIDSLVNAMSVLCL